jgi:uncharacterized protein DUF4019
MTVFRRFVLLLAAPALAWSLTAAAQPAPLTSGNAAVQPGLQPTLQDDQATIADGKKWLELIDAGKTGEAWDATAAYLKSTVARSEWIDGLRDIRKPFGKLVSRTPSRFARTHTMPNAPDADYAIVEYESVFAGGKSAVEQVAFKLEADGVFRVSGYFIR